MISLATKYSALLLACGNSMREDDGFALHLAEAASQRFLPTQLRILAAQQWTPEMAAEIAQAEVVIFADASICYASWAGRADSHQHSADDSGCHRRSQSRDAPSRSRESACIHRSVVWPPSTAGLSADCRSNLAGLFSTNFSESVAGCTSYSTCLPGAIGCLAIHRNLIASKKSCDLAHIERAMLRSKMEIGVG